jgi:glutamate-5-semialdehyde dehydrogenase
VIDMEISQLARRARQASRRMAILDSQCKNEALLRIASELRQNADLIFAANQQDLIKSEAEGIAAPLLKRLHFDPKKLDGVIKGLEDLATLSDPVGRTQLATCLDDGLDLYRVSCPIGVIGVIFESRPDALVQIASLCLKSGNSVLLKGGSEALETNRALAGVISSAGQRAGLPDGWIGLLETRTDVRELLTMERDVDLIIPRGSNEFVRSIMEQTHIPVIGHTEGICHLYIDSSCEPGMAIRLSVDSKTQYVAVCNAVETILVHAHLADSLLPALSDALQARGVEIFGCERTCARLHCRPVDDWHKEYLDYKVSLKLVDSLEEAIDHINEYGSRHTDAIVTSDPAAAQRFLQEVDSANVYWNCSTRFSDGFRYGFGAEVGISTGKFHARGPVGLEGLLTYQYRLIGQGQAVADYDTGECRFKHTPLKADYPL